MLAEAGTVFDELRKMLIELLKLLDALFFAACAFIADGPVDALVGKFADRAQRT